MQNTKLDEAQAGIKTARRNINNLRYADDTILMAESEEELETLDDGERGEWKKRAKNSTIKKWLYTSLERWDGEGDRREVEKGGDICTPMADSCWKFDRKQWNSVKQLSFNKK